MALDAIKQRRRDAEKRGKRSEYLAALYLTLRFYRVLAIRYKTPLGEIDIIAKKGDVLIFVEVKSRTEIGAAIDAVTAQSERRITAASQLWLARQKNIDHYSYRFDIIAMRRWAWPLHVINAF